MPIGLQRSYHYGTSKTGPIIRGGLFKNKDERVKDIRETLRAGEALIHYYQDLINPDSNCSLQVYLEQIDKKIKSLVADRRSLIAQHKKATNGEIPNLQRQQEELREKLTKLKVTMKVAKKIPIKIKDLREKIIALEQELYDATQTDIEELLEAL